MTGERLPPSVASHNEAERGTDERRGRTVSDRGGSSSERITGNCDDRACGCLPGGCTILTNNANPPRGRLSGSCLPRAVKSADYVEANWERSRALMQRGRFTPLQ